MSWVIPIIPRDGVRKLAARVVVSVEHILNTVPGLRSSQTCPEDLSDRRIPRQCDGFARQRIKKHSTTHSSHVRVVDPGLDIDRANRVDDNDGILMDTGHGIDQIIAIGPSGQVVAISVLQYQRCSSINH